MTDHDPLPWTRQPPADPSPPASGSSSGTGVTPTALPPPTAAVAIPRSGQIIGYVAGGVSNVLARPRPWGALALAIATLLVGPLALVDLVGGRRWVLTDLVAVALACGAGAALWQRLRQRLSQGTAPPPAQPSVPRRTFNLRPLSGGQLACVVEGDLGPVAWRHGDVLRVTGRLRGGTFVVRRVELLESPNGPVVSIVNGGQGIRAILDEWLDLLCWGLTGVVLLFALVLLSGVVF